MEWEVNEMGWYSFKGNAWLFILYELTFYNLQSYGTFLEMEYMLHHKKYDFIIPVFGILRYWTFPARGNMCVWDRQCPAVRWMWGPETSEHQEMYPA